MTIQAEDKLIQKIDRLLEQKQIDTDHFSYFNKNLEEMKNDVKGIKEKIDSHDEFVKNINALVPDIKEVVTLYKSASPIVRFMGKVIIGVPLFAAFIGGIIYIKDLWKH
jgi:septation ring formation regulator EzrA